MMPRCVRRGMMGREFYGGHRRAEQSQVAADIAAEFAGKPLALVWKPARRDPLLGHKNFELPLAQSLLAHAERARLRELDRAPKPRGMGRAR